jgi:hypothetical protein
VRVIVTADPDDFLLAMRAVKAAIDRDEKDTIICYGNDSNHCCFWVRRVKSGWSVRAETKPKR